MFENGDSEMWCDWRIQSDDLIRLAPSTTAEHKSNAALTLFKGKALQHFKEYTRTVNNLNNERGKSDKTPWDDDQKFFKVLDRVAKEFFPVKHAYRMQCFYLCYHLYIGGKFGVCKFMARLHRINACIPYFPRKTNTQGIKYCKRLPDDKLCDILNLAKKPEWTIKMLGANQDAYDYDLHGLTEYLKRLETATTISNKHNSTTHDDTSKASDKSRKRKMAMAMAMAMGNRVRSNETAIVTTTNHLRNRNVRSVPSAKRFTKENASSKTNLILNLIQKQMVQNSRSNSTPHCTMR
jgi:hypothetical protein